MSQSLAAGYREVRIAWYSASRWFYTSSDTSARFRANWKALRNRCVEFDSRLSGLVVLFNEKKPRRRMGKVAAVETVKEEPRVVSTS